MSQSPEELRDQIDNTRGRLSSDVDALADKVSPSSIAHRQTEKVRGSVNRMRERIMGASEDAVDSVSGHAQDMAHDLPGNVARQTQGNPLAAGLIAFGTGWLLSALIPASETEKQAVEALKDKAAPLMHEAGEAAKTVAENMKEPAQDAVQQVKEAAQDAAETIKAEGTSAAEDVKDSAQAGTDRMRDAASGNEFRA